MAQSAPGRSEAPVKRRRSTGPAPKRPSTEPVPLVRISPHYQAAIEMIGQRWTGAIIRSLLAGKTRFSDIRDSVPDLSDRLLWERLKTLEAHGLLERQVMNRRHTEYALTAKGKALEPVVRATAAWAEDWMASRQRRVGARAARRTA